MKEPLLERPVVSSPRQIRSGVRDSSPALCSAMIESLTTKVSQIQMRDDSEIDEVFAQLSLHQSKTGDTDCLRLGDEKENIPVNGTGVIEEEQDEKESVQTSEVAEDVKQEEEEKEEEEEEEEELGALTSRGPTKKEHASQRLTPYPGYHSSFNQQNFGQCTVHVSEAPVDICLKPQVPEASLQYNIYGEETDLYCIPDDDYPFFPVNEATSPVHVLSPSSGVASPYSLYDEFQTQDPPTLDDLLTIPAQDYYNLDELDEWAKKLINVPAVQGALESIQDEGNNIPTTVAEFSSPRNSPPTPSDMGYYSSRSTDSPSPINNHNYTGFYADDSVNNIVYRPTNPCFQQDSSADSFSTDFSHVVITSPGNYGQSVYQLPDLPKLSPITPDSSPTPSTSSPRLLPKPESSVLPSATTRVKERLNEAMKTRIWKNISQRTDEELTSADADGDTQLMILISASSKDVTHKPEYIYTLVERFKKIQHGLTSVNNQGFSALELTALFYEGSDRPLMTRYIAEALVHIGADVNTLNKSGETLLHVLCKEGDIHTNVLAELLAVKDDSGRLAFDLNMYNNKGRTALHEAVFAHGEFRDKAGKAEDEKIRSVEVVQLLMRAGANTTSLTVPDNCNLLQLAIASSCDEVLLGMLLSDETLTSFCQRTAYRQDTCLHQAAARNDLPLEQHGHVFRMLCVEGWSRGAVNEAGRVPLDLVAKERREVITNMSQKRRW